MKREKKGIPIYLGVASVWFGAHAGPGVASGKQTASFYSVFGKWGFITPVIAMGLMGLCIYYSVEYARVTGVKNFKELTDSLFYPHEKLFSIFFEVTFVATVLMVVGGCIATGAEVLEQYLGFPIIIGTSIIVFITIILSMYGADLVRASSTIMTIFIMVLLATIVIVGLLSPDANFIGHWQTSSFSDTSLLSAILMAITYTGFQSAGNIANAVSVSQGISSKKESKKAAVVGMILNTILILLIAILLFAYPESITETMPNYFLVYELGIPVLLFAYVTIVLLAVITTTVSFSFAVVARYGHLLPIKSEKKRNFTLVVILLILTVIVSLFGLDAIVNKGYKYLGYACIPLVVIPIILVGRKKTKNLELLEK